MTDFTDQPTIGAPPAAAARPLRPSNVRPVPLSELTSGLDLWVTGGEGDPMVSGLTLDSHAVCPGDLYVGLPGQRTHGAQFSAAAAEAGAVAVLTDPQGLAAATQAGLPVVISPQPRRAMAELAVRVYGHPADQLTCLAVTGTNGKTSTCFLLEEGLRTAGHHVGTVGTLGFRFDGETLAADRTTITTPEAPDLQALLGVFRERGADAIAMEVSSVALDQHRVDGCRFSVAAFTNLGRDHLDYHHTIEAYFEAKASLFTPGLSQYAVVNVDDPWGRTLLARIREQGMPVLTTGFAEACDVRIVQWTPSRRGGAQIDVRLPDGRPLSVEIDLPGEFNVRNAVTAMAMILAAGFDLDAALPGISRAQIPGRMQLVPLPGGPRVYVDFAHTPQAISSSLAAVSGRVITVLGAGGDRDQTKRLPMGRAAVLGSDVVVVTDDNPRSEDPATIRAGVLAGAQGAIEAAEPGSRTARVLLRDGGDRRHAIDLALGLAGPQDAVVILGKGHEKTQQVGNVTRPFDDVAVVQELWAARQGRQA